MTSSMRGLIEDYKGQAGNSAAQNIIANRIVERVLIEAETPPLKIKARFIAKRDSDICPSCNNMIRRNDAGCYVCGVDTRPYHYDCVSNQ